MSKEKLKYWFWHGLAIVLLDISNLFLNKKTFNYTWKLSLKIKNLMLICQGNAIKAWNRRAK